jgi:hypothetical protein
MMTMPKTTYRFSAYSYDEDTQDNSETIIEFTTQEETLTELCEKFGDFLRASGFSYVKDVIAYDTWEDERYEMSDPDESLDFSSEQPSVDDGIQLSMFDTDSGTVSFSTDATSPTYTTGTMYPGDINITYGGVSTVPVRNSIDDATPEEWNEVNRKVYNSKY